MLFVGGGGVVGATARTIGRLTTRLLLSVAVWAGAALGAATGTRGGGGSCRKQEQKQGAQA